ncbi:hypothetical protein ACP70R_040244 [Stipagrostis hirtigluma subsp. patula]
MATGRWEFTHPAFKQGDQQLLSKIKRRPPRSAPTRILGRFLPEATRSQTSDNTSAIGAPTSAEPSIQTVLDENAQLKANNEILYNELVHTRHLYAQAVQVIEHGKAQLDAVADIYKGKGARDPIVPSIDECAPSSAHETRLFGVKISSL